jgi:hypothetical protein
VTGTESGAVIDVRLVIRANASDVLFPIDHPYLERCWTSVLGPSAVLLLRRVNELAQGSRNADVDLHELSRDLGIAGVGLNSHLRRTIDRLVRFGFACWSSPSVLDIYDAVPPLACHHLTRATDAVRIDHHRLIERYRRPEAPLTHPLRRTP